MINSASFRPQDPNVYAQQYANTKGISLEEAKTQLKTQHGDPAKQGDVSLFNQTNSTSSTNGTRNFSDYFTEEDLANFDSSSAMDNLKGLFQNFMNFFKAGDGPQKEGDPQLHIGQSNTSDGPQKAGDPQPHINNTNSADGPQKEGDPQPHLNNSNNSSDGPQKEGDPQPHLGQSNNKQRLPETKEDKDAYARQYAEENDITFEEAKEILASMQPDMEQE